MPIQEQLSTQLITGIVSADLAPGERLPSSSELARRFSVHANTVRAAYRGLAERGWIEWRPGSGFYVRANDDELKSGSPIGLEHLISRFLKAAREHGHTLSEIQSEISRWLSVQSPDHILVIEPDADLRDILVAEIHGKVSARVEGGGIEECRKSGKHLGAVVVALSYRADEIRATLSPETPSICLHSSSIPKILLSERKPMENEVITIASRWPDFLSRARATLVAVGIDPVSIDMRDGRKEGWDRGLGAHSFIITDTLLASRLPKQCHPRIFSIIADESIAELKAVLAG